MLTDYFFKLEYDGQNIFLCITLKDLDRIGEVGLGIKDSNIDFIQTVLDGPEAIYKKTGIVDKAIQLYSLNKEYGYPIFINRDKELKDNINIYPPYLSYLVFSKDKFRFCERWIRTSNDTLGRQLSFA